MNHRTSYWHLALAVILSLAATALFLSLLSLGVHTQAVAAPALPAQYGVQLSPGSTKTTEPGTVVTFIHTITNVGQFTDTFLLEVAPPAGWEYALGSDPQGTLGLPSLLLSLGNGQTGTLFLTLTVPLNQPPGSYTAVLTATSQSDQEAAAAVSDTVVVIPIERVQLSPGTTITAGPGTVVAFIHTITNVGQLTDTFTLTAAPPTDWEYALGTDPPGTLLLPSLLLGSGQTGTLFLTLTVPLNQRPGSYTAVLTATPQSDQGATAIVSDTVVVSPIERVQLSPGTTKRVDPGSVVTFAHLITNVGQFTDTFTLTAAPPAQWQWSLNTLTLTLRDGQTGTLVLTLTVPHNARGGFHTLILTATPSSDPDASRAVTDTVHVTSYIYLPLVMRNYPPVPAGTITIEAGKPTVYRPNVTLTLSAIITGDQVAYMSFSNDAQTWSAWEAYNTTKSWTLKDGISGLRTVYVRFKGSKGGISAPVYDTIYLAWDGDFEQGWGTYWSRGQGGFSGHGTGLPQSIVPFEGSNRVLLGTTTGQDGALPVGYGYTSQQYEVPANGRLRFKYRVHSRDTIVGTTTGYYYDSFEFSINRAPGQITDAERNARGCNDQNRLNPHQTTLTPQGAGLVFCGGQVVAAQNLPGEWDSGWRTVTVDLGAFSGTTITLYMAVWSREYQPAFYNDRAHYNTYAYVDDVELWQGP